MLNKTKKTEFIATRCTKETYDKLHEIAEKDDRTISYIIDKAIREYIEKEIGKNSTN